MLKKIKTLVKRISAMRNWYFFIWPLNRFSSWPKEARLRSGANFFIPALYSSACAIFNEIVVDDVYEISTYPSDVKKVVDLGANIGVYSIVMAKKYPNAEIISLEPERKNFDNFSKNIKISNLNLKPLKKAVSNEKGKTILFTDPTNPGAHSIVKSGRSSQTEEIETVTLDELLPADILKVDVEGAEYKIFDKIPDCKIIVMETHNGDDKKLLGMFSEKYNIQTKGPIHIMRNKNLN